ncbi:metal-sulfur cluster assembly factor [Paraburkholderia lycopersici]|uniref:Metal-sulfur cluster biosynthetic enzyme n=1 Tax=Paraburkholderia lycopersici TaxID=416944 RepID=A0A1G6HE73_9BURK|nr:metal-sulfur cluster assembly factor [Paraburkholderia lycopersici]SDB92398.1 Metal-sulfur cluster biosynthetic enzyme [Paraburkholderia lycopersici]
MNTARIKPDDTNEEREIREALRSVIDPEVGVNIVDLGLVYGIARRADGLKIDITMTSPACPMSQMVIDEVRAVAEEMVSDDTTVEVELVWDPAWAPAMMSEPARQVLGWEPD